MTGKHGHILREGSRPAAFTGMQSLTGTCQGNTTTTSSCFSYSERVVKMGNISGVSALLCLFIYIYRTSPTNAIVSPLGMGRQSPHCLVAGLRLCLSMAIPSSCPNRVRTVFITTFSTVFKPRAGNSLFWLPG